MLHLTKYVEEIQKFLFCRNYVFKCFANVYKLNKGDLKLTGKTPGPATAINLDRSDYQKQNYYQSRLSLLE